MIRDPTGSRPSPSSCSTCSEADSAPMQSMSRCWHTVGSASIAKSMWGWIIGSSKRAYSNSRNPLTKYCFVALPARMIVFRDTVCSSSTNGKAQPPALRSIQRSEFARWRGSPLAPTRSRSLCSRSWALARHVLGLDVAQTDIHSGSLRSNHQIDIAVEDLQERQHLVDHLR